MDPDRRSSAPRKVKFTPKAPRRPAPKSTKNSVVAVDDSEDEESQQSLARKVNEHLTKRGKKVEKKSPVQVAFQHGVSSTAIRTFGNQTERTDDESEKTNDGSAAAYLKGSPVSEKQNLVASTSTAGTGVGENIVDLTETETVKKKKEYQEPWDYLSNYPITLPLRKPYSGDPEFLDKAEFEEALEYDENSLPPAAYHLGLWAQDVDDEEKAKKLFFLTFPSKLPLVREQTETSRRETDDSLKGKVTADSVSRGSGMSTGKTGKEAIGSSRGPARKECSLDELPEGYMGKMYVYKSGAVKLKLGEVLYDVSPGSDIASTERFMAINTANRHCCDLGPPDKRIVVTPDIDSLFGEGMD